MSLSVSVCLSVCLFLLSPLYSSSLSNGFVIYFILLLALQVKTILDSCSERTLVIAQLRPPCHELLSLTSEGEDCQVF